MVYTCFTPIKVWWSCDLALFGIVIQLLLLFDFLETSSSNFFVIYQLLIWVRAKLMEVIVESLSIEFRRKVVIEYLIKLIKCHKSIRILIDSFDISPYSQPTLFVV